MRKIKTVILFSLIWFWNNNISYSKHKISSSSLTQVQTEKNDSFELELAYAHAPIHYQETDKLNTKADMLTSVNYDGNWVADDNWDNFKTGNFNAVVYYSVSETKSNWFILYSFFHPKRLMKNNKGEEHENDMQGILSVIKKNKSTYGDLEFMITVANNQFYTFAKETLVKFGKNEPIDGKIYFTNWQNHKHPKTYQEAKRHGIKAFVTNDNFLGKKNKNGIIYYPSKKITSPLLSTKNSKAYYQLVSLTSNSSIWEMQLNEAETIKENNIFFAKWGVMKGNKTRDCGNGVAINCKEDACSMPWNWVDANLGTIHYPGILALDPAEMVLYYFKTQGYQNDFYLKNPFLQSLYLKGFNNNKLPIGMSPIIDLNKLYKKINLKK